MDVLCYGKDVADAWDLNDAVYAELRYNRPLTINGKHVTQLSPSGGGTQDYDSDGDWPFVFTEYTLVISEGDDSRDAAAFGLLEATAEDPVKVDQLSALACPPGPWWI